MPLLERRGGRLYIKNTDDWVKIISSNGYYPETVLCEFADGTKKEFTQMAPNLYALKDQLRKRKKNA